MAKVAEKDLQKQIDDINVKLDTILECALTQKQRSERMDDLVADANIIAKDAFRSTVNELEVQGIELNWDDIRFLFLKFLKNIDKFTWVMDTFESMYDLMQDMGPVVRETIIDFIRKMGEFEQKGYFEFANEMLRAMDNVVTHYSGEDVKLLADNVVTIMDTVKNMTQPDMLQAMNNAVNVFQKLEVDDIPEYSLWKAMKEMRSPEMKKGIGFMISFLKNLSNENRKLFTYNSRTTVFLIIVFGLTLIQIVLGTQVRQFVDEQVAEVGETAKNLWLSTPAMTFYIHRSFSILVVLFNLYLAYRIYKLNLGLSKINWVLLILLIEVITGMAMFYLDFPFMSQALHLVLASLLFGVQFYLVLESYISGRSPKTS